MTSQANAIWSLFLVALVLLAAISIVYASWRNGISPMPTSSKVRRIVADEVGKLGQGNGRLLAEAGAGWGTLALHLAKRCAGWRIVGIENSFVPLAVSKWMALTTSAKSDVAFLRGDLYAYNYRSADLVVCYLYPGAMKRLGPILRDQLRPGARVISVCFAVPDLQPVTTLICSDLYRTPVYIYRMSDQEPFHG